MKLKKIKNQNPGTTLSSTESKIFSAEFFRSFFSILIITVFLAGCTTKSQRKFEDLDDNVVAEFEVLEKKALTGANTESTLMELDRFMKRHPEPAWIARAENTKGLVFFRMQKWQIAEEFFRKALQSTKSKYLGSMIRINWAATKIKLGHHADALQALKFAHEDVLDPSNQKKLYQLRLQTSLKVDSFITAIKSYGQLWELDFEGSRDVARHYEQVVRDGFELKLELEEQKKVMSFIKNTPIGPETSFLIGRRYYDKGQTQSAKNYLEMAEDLDPKGSIGAASSGLLSRIDKKPEKADPYVVGAILPLTGKFSKFSEQAIKGLEQSFKLLGRTGAYRLVFADSKGSESGGSNAVDYLVHDMKVIAIVGGLTTKSATSQAIRASKLGVPFVSLAQKDMSEKGGEWTFQIGTTHKHQVENILKFAGKNLNIKNMALIHSNEGWAKGFVDAFWDQVGRNGMKVKAVASYGAGRTDFRDEVQQLVGLSNVDSRKIELEGRRKYVEAVRENNPRAFKRGRDPEKLPPIVEFEGVFIPAFPKEAAQIIPTFAYEEVRGVRFFGINTWNTTLFLKRVGSYAESSVFPAAFNLEDPSVHVQDFLKEYRLRFQEDPDVLAATAFDGGKLLLDTMSRTGVKTRDELADELRKLEYYRGITGNMAFPGNGSSRKELYLFMVQNGKSVPLKAPGSLATASN